MCVNAPAVKSWVRSCRKAALVDEALLFLRKHAQLRGNHSSQVLVRTRDAKGYNAFALNRDPNGTRQGHFSSEG